MYHYNHTSDLSCLDSIGGEFGNEFNLDGIIGDESAPDYHPCKICFEADSLGDRDITGLDIFNDSKVTVLLDDFYHGEFLVTNGKITVERDYIQAVIGYGYSGIVKTLPISNPNNPSQFNYNRVVKIIANFYESSGITLDGQIITDRQFGDWHIGSKPELISGIREVYTLGWDRFVQFELRSDFPYKFHLLSFSAYLDTNKPL